MAKKASGAEEYKPTRLEWLVVMVNSMLPNVSDKYFLAYCFAGEDEKSIIVHIKYDRRADKEHVSKIETDVKELILTISKMYEWDSWVNIETVISVKD